MLFVVEAVVEAASEVAVVLAGEAAVGVGVDVVALAAVGSFVAVLVRAPAVSDLQDAAQHRAKLDGMDQQIQAKAAERDQAKATLEKSGIWLICALTASALRYLKNIVSRLQCRQCVAAFVNERLHPGLAQ